MFERPEGLAGFDAKGQPNSQYYGLGWTVKIIDSDHFTASHSGSLPGTNTILTRRADGRNVAILFNTRASAESSRIVSDVLPELNSAIDSIKEWPEHNLFEN